MSASLSVMCRLVRVLIIGSYRPVETFSVGHSLKRVNKHVKIEGIIGTFFNNREVQCLSIVEQLREKFGPLVYKTLVRRNTDIAKAAAWTEPIVIAEPHSLGGSDYLALADEFLRRHDGGKAQ